MAGAAARSISRARAATPRSRSCWLEISPQRAERRERGKRRGLGTQDARTEARPDEAGALERRLLLLRESRLRPGRDHRLLLHLDLPDRPALGGKQQSRPALVRLVLVKSEQRQDLRDAVAPALLAGGDCDLPPVLDPG